MATLILKMISKIIINYEVLFCNQENYIAVLYFSRETEKGQCEK